MGLRKITQADKLWVAFRIMPRDSIRLAAADIASSVLLIYEEKYPNDLRPRRAIEAAYVGDSNAANAAANANAAAYAANAADAAYAANAAAYAAYAATYAATYAANAATTAAYAATTATYAAAIYAADADAYAAAYAAAIYAANADAYADKRDAQEKLIRKICLKYMK
jgi:hypothetical protein